MSETLRITQARPERTSLDYTALREAGLERIRRLAKETWTDHNVHDPGITLLEAFSYAITELGFRIQLDMADLLESGEARAPARLVPAHRALPSGPIALADLRKLLLDHPATSDALIVTGVDSEVAFYENPLAGPPLTYAPNGARVRPRGLTEVLIAFGFDDRQLNANSYERTIAFGGDSYAIDVALPHWDEEEAAPFRAGETAAGVSLVGPPGGVWRPLPEPQAFFGEVQVALGGGGSAQLWVLLRIADPVQPADLAGVLAAAEAEVESSGPGSLIREFIDRVRTADAVVSQVERYLAGWRNLSEETIRVSAAREQEIAVNARIEVTGGADLERLLAEIFLAIDRQLSPPLSFRSLQQMRDRGYAVEEIFDGPLLAHGFLDDRELASLARPSAIYASDLLRLIMRLRGAAGTDVVAQENPTGRDIVAVSDLQLSNFVNNRPITTGARDCLRLVETRRYRPRLSLAKSTITFVRDEVEVAYDAARVRNLFQDGLQRDWDAALTDDPSPVLAAPVGESLPIEDYYPFQNDLPRVYGLGEGGLAEGVGVERRARALQAKGYLVLFEQFLSDVAAQLGHVNRFFSPDPDETATYFPRPLFDLAGIDKLLRRFEPGADWQAFVADPRNPHRRELEAAAEDADRFLDRRNRMLDHLLAREGRETVAWGQELHRWAQSQLSAAAPAAAIAARRRAVNARLVRGKSELLRDAPELSAFRLQAFGTLLQRRPELLGLEEVEGQDGPAFDWLLTAGGELRLRSASSFGSEADAAAAGADALGLAGQPALYQNVHVGGGFRRYRLTDRAGAGGRVLGESPTTFTTVGAAQAALEATAALFARSRLEASFTPMERLIAHLTGTVRRIREPLLTPIGTFFELDDAAVGDGVIDGWRLRAEPGPAGAALLTSVGPFTAATDGQARALAEESLNQVFRYGIFDWSYAIVETPANTFRLSLNDSSGTAIAHGVATFSSRADAEQAAPALVDHLVEHLHRRYSAEGLHLVEHLLLRPRQTGDEFLELPAAGGGVERDPYSQRLSLIFPSGHARDFTQPPQSATRTAVAPHRFRDLEFRRHAQRMVERACPAHLLPTIFWVDRDRSPNPARGSFEEFEGRYLAWLESVLVPGGAPVAVRAARNQLIRSLNAVARA